jgi:hypothetical protein
MNLATANDIETIEQPPVVTGILLRSGQRDGRGVNGDSGSSSITKACDASAAQNASG